MALHTQQAVEGMGRQRDRLLDFRRHRQVRKVCPDRFTQSHRRLAGRRAQGYSQLQAKVTEEHGNNLDHGTGLTGARPTGNQAKGLTQGNDRRLPLAFVAAWAKNLIKQVRQGKIAMMPACQGLALPGKTTLVGVGAVEIEPVEVQHQRCQAISRDQR